mmetsp:Transcript_25686/g.81577  ORF Transcript_25686/g.81577 Transcript_25686/m.81577 type:complete len:136 (+) Transcript_25686:181-588(+)|eukprot:CAMPEP_0182865478 /NCGR_PEP_ID=MMETSP0034_2-20130328/7707_1 /TAXON_ID=156128 /ORGANISM="Nephroselmis pyriformis, Strain CCMP717" /LENGTH=135 /DNA_ID=CAMNT_0024997773 /DNA_START=71 /DNA_END=478 /DNA_ORIENTATION=+
MASISLSSSRGVLMMVLVAFVVMSLALSATASEEYRARRNLLKDDAVEEAASGSGSGSGSGACVSTPPPEWTCSCHYYDNGDGCDCGCGAFDPDCNKDVKKSGEPQEIYGCLSLCEDGGICKDQTGPWANGGTGR